MKYDNDTDCGSTEYKLIKVCEAEVFSFEKIRYPISSEQAMYIP